MSEQEKLQIINLLSNLEASKKYLPYFSDLEKHEVFGQVFSTLSKEKKHEVSVICEQYVLDRLVQLTKTKGGQLFQRFVESQNELFWQFRKMNDSTVQDSNFQKVGRQVETEMFKLEGILTEKMLKQEKGLDQVVSSFYNLVFLFFPRFNEVGIED